MTHFAAHRIRHIKSLAVVAAGLASFLAPLGSANAGGPCQPHWDSAIGQPGMNGFVTALALFDDGSGDGPALYAAGNFTLAGGVVANRIAKWDGQQWSPLGSGLNAAVSAIAVFDDGRGGGPALYVGGDFTIAGGVPASRIAKWNGQQWSALGTGLKGQYFATVAAMIALDEGTSYDSGPALYVAGHFSLAGDVPANSIVRWDGQNFTPLGDGLSDQFPAWIGALKFYDDGSIAGGGPALYAGGSFSLADGKPVSNIARWDGQQWSALGPPELLPPNNGVDNPVLALGVFDGSLYVAGEYASAGGITVNGVARWDGEQWHQIGSPDSPGVGGVPYPWVQPMTHFNDGATSAGGSQAIYMGGDFISAGGVTLNNIGRWDGTQWTALAGGVNGWTHAMLALDEDVFGGNGPALYVSGGFTEVDGLPANRIAVWRGCVPSEPCFGDLNHDGNVGVTDLLMLLAAWGECPASMPCAADLTGGGSVGVADLLQLLGAWGPCD